MARAAGVRGGHACATGPGVSAASCAPPVVGGATRAQARPPPVKVLAAAAPEPAKEFLRQLVAARAAVQAHSGRALADLPEAEFLQAAAAVDVMTRATALVHGRDGAERQLPGQQSVGERAQAQACAPPAVRVAAVARGGTDGTGQVAGMEHPGCARPRVARPAPMGEVRAVQVRACAAAHQNWSEAADRAWWRRQRPVNYTPYNEQRQIERAAARAARSGARGSPGPG